MKSLLIESEFNYDGSQLRSLFGYLEHRIQGDSVIAGIGSCSVPFMHMIDGEDLLAKSAICGVKMVHFIVERFHTPLFAAVTLQRLFAAICLDFLRSQVPEKVANQLRREGDDLFFLDGKLSISIATLSPISCLIHFAVNCSNEGTPVHTAALSDLGIDPRFFAASVMTRLLAEVGGIEEATVKVKWVK